MEAWTIKELEKWLKVFDNPSDLLGYFTNTQANQETINKAKELLKKKRGNNDL
tara:strand:- start:459 stop:617 length:159 start_codon:yes stop_codon:yes gene_type:complete